jgi:hypothetical protein
MIRIKEKLATSEIEIAGQTALDSTTLGTGVVNSSLTRVGTVTQGTWSASVISGEHGGTGVANTGKTITLGHNLTTQGAYPVTLIAPGEVSITLPTSGTITTGDSTASFTNKTFNLANNTLTGTLAEFNSALSTGNFATLAGNETLTNKTVNLAEASGNVLTGTLAEFNTALSDGTFATLAGVETLTNKTVNLAAANNNTLTGTTAEFNTALSDGDFATLAGTETVTNKTVNLANNTLTGTTAEFNSALSDGTFATLAGTETVTNKTVNLASNTLTGTIAQFNTALSDGTFATLAGTEALTNKTVNLANNTLTGTIAEFNAALTDNSFATLAGTESLTNKTINLNSASGNSLIGTLAEFNAALTDGDFATINTGTESLVTYDISNYNTTLPGSLLVPATFTIDPEAHGDATGTVVIAGDLQVDGITTVTLQDNSVTNTKLNLTYTSTQATGDNSTVDFTIEAGHTVNDILVILDGNILPPVDYSIVNNNTLRFVVAPLNLQSIDIRYLPV